MTTSSENPEDPGISQDSPSPEALQTSREARARKVKAMQRGPEREERLRKLLFRGFGAVTVLAVLGVMVFVLLTGAQKPSGENAKGEQKTPTKVTADGTFPLGQDGNVIAASAAQARKGTRTLMVFDPQCPGCGAVERSLGDTLQSLNKQDKISLFLSPISFLGQQSTDDYSTRAASAVVTVAEGDPTKVQAFIKEIYKEANQPSEGTNYKPVSDAKLAQWARQAGVTEAVAASIPQEAYLDWVTKHTAALEKRTELFPNGLSTPAIFLGGKVQGTSTPGATRVQFTGQEDPKETFIKALAAANGK